MGKIRSYLDDGNYLSDEELAKQKVLERRKRFQLPEKPITGPDLIEAIKPYISIEEHAKHSDVVAGRESPKPFGPTYEPDKITAPKPEETAPEPEEVKQARREMVKKKLAAKKLLPPSYGPKHNPKAIQKGLDDDARAKLKERLLAKAEAKKAEDQAKSDDMDRNARMGQYAALAGEVLADMNEKQDAYYHRKANARAEVGGLSPVKYDHSILRKTGQMAKDLTAQERSDYLKKKLQEKADARYDKEYADKRGDRAADVAYRDKKFGADQAYRKQALEVSKNKNININQSQMTPTQFKLSKLGGEERKRLDSATMGLEAAKNMRKALDNGVNTFSIVGDNDFTMSATRWKDAIGRMQSGGAINADEGEMFRSMAPTVWDSAEIQKKKLDWMEAEMTKRIGNLGFNAAELNQPQQPSQADQDAYQWAMANPEDERAKEIIKKLRATYGK